MENIKTVKILFQAHYKVLKKLTKKVLAIILTNQPAVAKGIFL